MDKKSIFIEEIKLAMENGLVLSDDAAAYFKSLSVIKEVVKPKFTENGKTVLTFMRENEDRFENTFTAKSIGEDLGISSKTVSGAMRKLVLDGYVEKLGDSPVSYSLTEVGRTTDIEA